MKFRYFKLKGKSLKVYLESEKKEMGQRKAMTKVLLEDRDDIENFRTSHGDVYCVKFKEGMQPSGFVKAHKDLSPREVRPHGRSKEAKPWRELFKSLSVTEDCQSEIRKFMKLPDFVLGGPSGRGFGRACYSSRVGHVGDDVFVEVPVSEETPYEPHDDLKEVKGWQFEKAIEESDDELGAVYKLTSRASS